jgi:hypothetical protein
MTFEFGRCKTDHKKGVKLQRPIDFVNDKPYAEATRKALSVLGIPMPKDENIFRGNKHDMLFLNSHGVVVRIGHTDIKDLMNPAILQPLGWLEDKALEKDGRPFCVAIYPGIELYKHYKSRAFAPRETPGSITEVLSMTEQRLHDLHEDNKGIIRVETDTGVQRAVALLIDIDNDLNGVIFAPPDHAARRMRAEFNARHPGEVIERYMNDVITNADKLLPRNSAVNISDYKKAFAAHAPLRDTFWSAFKTCDLHAASPLPAQRFDFWHTCRGALNKASVLPYPLWTSERDEQGNISFTRQEIPATVTVSLYRPWTAKLVDIPHATAPKHASF